MSSDPALEPARLEPLSVPAQATPVHPALLLLGLGQPAAPEDQADGSAAPTSFSPAQPAFLLLGLHQTAGSAAGLTPAGAQAATTLTPGRAATDGPTYGGNA